MFLSPYIKFTNNNVAKSNGTGIDLFFMTKPLPNIDLMFNGNYWHDELDGVQADQVGSEYGFWGMINSTIRLQNDQEIGRGFVIKNKSIPLLFDFAILLSSIASFNFVVNGFSTKTGNPDSNTSFAIM